MTFLAWLGLFPAAAMVAGLAILVAVGAAHALGLGLGLADALDRAHRSS